LQPLFRRSTLPMIRPFQGSTTVMVSSALLATKTRRPSGDSTMFHGSAPVASSLRPPTFRTLALKWSGSGLSTQIVEIVPAAVFATTANRSKASTATPWGSSPTAILATTCLVSVRMTDTVSSAGFTDQTSRPLLDMAMGLE
jgi:hypothetical protein